MFQPQTYAMALSLMLVTMVCWGSWANTIKLCPGYRFQLFYWDYVVGLILAALIWGFGVQLKEHLADAGVNVDGISTSQCSSGVAVIVASEAGRTAS